MKTERVWKAYNKSLTPTVIELEHIGPREVKCRLKTSDLYLTCRPSTINKYNYSTRYETKAYGSRKVITYNSATDPITDEGLAEHLSAVVGAIWPQVGFIMFDDVEVPPETSPLF